MAVSNVVVKSSSQGDGIVTGFSIPFKVIEDDSAETKVYIRDESDAENPTETLQTEGAMQDYTLTGANPPSTPFHTTVEFNTAPTADQKVVIIRQLTITHDLDLDANSPIPPETLEDKIDRCVALVQQIDEANDRSIKLPITEQVSADLEIPEPFAGKILGFNAGGTQLQMYSATDIAASATGGFGSTNNKAVANSETTEAIPGMTIDRATYKGAVVHFMIERSTTVFASGFLFLQDLNGTWRVKESLFSGEEHGLTWAMTEAAGIGTVNYTSDTLGAGTLYWSIMKMEA